MIYSIQRHILTQKKSIPLGEYSSQATIATMETQSRMYFGNMLADRTEEVQSNVAKCERILTIEQSFNYIQGEQPYDLLHLLNWCAAEVQLKGVEIQVCLFHDVRKMRKTFELLWKESEVLCICHLETGCHVGFAAGDSVVAEVQNWLAVYIPKHQLVRRADDPTDYGCDGFLLSFHDSVSGVARVIEQNPSGLAMDRIVGNGHDPTPECCEYLRPVLRIAPVRKADADTDLPFLCTPTGNDPSASLDACVLRFMPRLEALEKSVDQLSARMSRCNGIKGGKPPLVPGDVMEVISWCSEQTAYNWVVLYMRFMGPIRIPGEDLLALKLSWCSPGEFWVSSFLEAGGGSESLDAAAFVPWLDKFRGEHLLFDECSGLTLVLTTNSDVPEVPETVTFGPLPIRRMTLAPM